MVVASDIATHHSANFAETGKLVQPFHVANLVHGVDLLWAKRMQFPRPRAHAPTDGAQAAGCTLLLSLNRLRGSYCALIFCSRGYAGP